ncbi:DUF6493 family protein [Chitinophaga rhizophila]|uniref:Uncharacterized protein n=1 Tax=Chitinophaga rhizophila TaxID=2866212 RepID=A0ABS7GJ73_9BACT|nr:DUF6493 family protein [Chitinophaga rhizophila]MBW8687759.1 hypothetical protein [Chitinophaga rhizophila]
MTIQEQFAWILDNVEENKIVPFLRLLSDEDRNALIPELRKWLKYYSEYVTTDNKSYRSRATAQHWRIIASGMFVCCDRKEFERNWINRYVLEGKLIFELLDFYQPSWFNDYINGMASQENIGIGYGLIMQLTDKGYLRPSPDLIAKTLPSATRIARQQGSIFTLELIEERPVTLDEHIWHLFNYESNLNWADKWSVTPGNNHQSWMEVLKQYAAKGRISRIRLLKEALAASARNFNKVLSGWFADLFVYLQPAEHELLTVQADLMMALSAVQSKAVGNALMHLKKISTHADFEVHTFLQYVPVLLSSATKAVHTATLSILEVLAKKYPADRNAICEVVANAFISSDNATQTKAAKLIAAYGDETSPELITAIGAVESSLLAGPKELVRKWLQTAPPEVAPTSEADVFSPVVVLSEHTLITIPEDVEGLIFLISQSLDNNEHYHLEQVLSSVIRLHKQITEAHFKQLEPAFQRAFKMLMKGISGNAGLLDELLAVFLIEYGLLLEQQYPVEGAGFRKQYDKQIAEDKKREAEWSYYKLMIVPVSDWTRHTANVKAYEVYRQLVLTALTFVQQGIQLPLVSMPTHKGGWIDPVVLVERLNTYQLAGVAPALMDMQVAIARVSFENSAVALTAAAVLEGEYKRLLAFLLDQHAQPAGPFDTPVLWMLAGLCKSPETVYQAFQDFPYTQINRAYLTGQFAWKTFSQKYLAYGNYSKEKKEYERYDAWRTVLKVDFPDSPNVTIAKNNYGGKDVIYRNVCDTPLLQEYMNGNKQQISENDIQRVLSLSPGNPDIQLAYFIDSAMNSALLDEVTERRGVLRKLEALYVLKNDLREMSYLFLATAMLNADSTNRSMAAEIWIDRVASGTVDSGKIGAIIGTHQQLEWAPMKRWTDLIGGRMQKVSARHNIALESMMTSCLLQLPAAGVKDLKKLLEVYHEVLVANGTKIEVQTLIGGKLEEWKALAPVKKAVAAILAL